MDNSEEIKKYAEDTVKSVSLFLESALKGLDNMKNDLSKTPELAEKLANEMKAAEMSEQVKKLREELKNLNK